MSDFLLKVEGLGAPYQALISLIFIGCLFVFNKIVSGRVLRNGANMEVARAIVIRSRTVSGLIIWVALLLLWSTELKHALVSLAALGAATILAAKEMITCWLGSIYRALARPFDVGDTIEIDGIRGAVIDIGVMSFRVAELGAGYQSTGAVLTIPFSLLLSHSARGLSSQGDYVLHFARIPIASNLNVTALSDVLLLAGKEVCSSHEDAARASLRLASLATMTNTTSPAPKVAIEPKNFEQIDLVLRFSCPKDERVSFEQEILSLFYARSFDYNIQRVTTHKPSLTKCAASLVQVS